MKKIITETISVPPGPWKPPGDCVVLAIRGLGSKLVVAGEVEIDRRMYGEDDDGWRIPHKPVLIAATDIVEVGAREGNVEIQLRRFVTGATA